MSHEKSKRLTRQELDPSPRGADRSKRVSEVVQRIRDGYYLTDEVARITAQKMVRRHGPLP